MELLAHVQTDPLQLLQEHLPLRDRTLVRHILRLVRPDIVRALVDRLVQRAVHGPAASRHGPVRQGLQRRDDDDVPEAVQAVAERRAV